MAQHCPTCGQPHILQGKYRIVRMLGRGGFGVVYEARDLRLNRPYAIKIIGVDPPILQQQVESEANILARHARKFPFMPEIYDIWSTGNRTFLVMEFIDGMTLGEILDRHGTWSVVEVAQFLRTMLEQLAQLHGAGIIHRDLKPANIKRTVEGRYVLLDFGIAKHQPLTIAGVRALSPFYSPPEQINGGRTDARSDLYSLAATAYHLLMGKPPPSAAARMRDEHTLPTLNATWDQVPQALETVLFQMLELDPDMRPKNAQATLELLDSLAARGDDDAITVQRGVPTTSLTVITTYAPSLQRRAGTAVLTLPPQWEWSFWLWWVLENAAAWAIARGLGWLAGSAIYARGSIDLGGGAFLYAGGLAFAIETMVMGFVIGSAQWLILRRYLPYCERWVFNSVVVWMVLGGLCRIIGGAAGGVLLGMALGIAQWFELKRSINSIFLLWWILVSMAGWSLVWQASGPMNALFYEVLGGSMNSIIYQRGIGWALALLQAQALIGVAFGAITGSFLVWIIRQSRVSP